MCIYARPVELIDRLHSTSLAGLKAAVVPGEQVYSFGVNPDLALQAEALRREFAGQSELLLYHAILMVLLRRRIDLETNLLAHEDALAQRSAVPRCEAR